ncbi:protein SCAF11 isoform X5 [Balaenoptera acutorostrata]|uniref:Protein SCAF11 isoform X5 n=1 Tax=Balaenoptera acutorostrata TaxID=9767 RepID=A0A383ZVX4_BALAC|nr:protein SCAF11 isoform X5 [Balaenoptera acutorostrata]
MKKKTLYTLNVGDQDYEDMEGEENKDNTATTGLLYSEADRCPICLSCLLEKEIGFPESCNHVFCLTCILKWAETLASCPIDRKPFQAVFKFSALESCVKVHIKRQLRETNDKKNESSFKKQLSCQENSKSCMRKKVKREDLLSAKLYDLKMIYRNSKYSEMGGKENAIIKTNKPQRSNPCTNQCFRNFFSSIFSSSSHTGESSFTCTAYRTEFIEVNEISALIRQKRQELELSWFPDTLPGIGRISFIPWNIETEVLPLISSVLPRTIFPTNTISLENFGTSCKGYALAHTQEGEEKKQTSGTSSTRGSRRKPAATTPTRRSTRNTRAEPVSQSQRSPVSNNSGCDAPDSNNPSVSVSSSGESEKQTRQAPKRKSVRRGRKLPLLKKKLRSSLPPPEKSSSSDSVDEEIVESDIPPVLEKEHQSDVESSNTVQINVENESANGLRSCSEPVEESEEHSETRDTEERVESLYSESGTQDPPVLVGEEEEIQTVENTGIEANILCLESEISKNTSEKGGDPLENQDQIALPSESEVKADGCTDHLPNDFLTCSGSEIEVHQPISSLGEIPENAESAVNEEKVMESPIVKIIDHKDSTVKTEHLIDSPKLESSEGGIIQTVDKKSIESSEVHLLGHVENEDAEVIATCDTSGNENFSSIQDSENNLLKKNLNTKLDKSFEEKTESLVEHPRSTELPKTHVALIQKHFSEDNNEMIPMECDSFCSDQNESELEPSVNADAKQLNENSVEHSSQKNMSSSGPSNEKVETVSQPSEIPIDTIDKAKKPRTRRSRFHSPSTTWSPNKETAREKKRSQSPSPKRETGKESRKSRSPSPKKESARGRRKSRSQSPKKDPRERRKSQSRSPKRDSTREGKRSESLSPKRDTSRENRRSQSRLKDSSPREKSRSRSRERESDRDGPKRDRDRERRTRRWSRSRSRSRSPSRSRTKSKSSSFGRNDRVSYSPRWKERWTNDGWRCPRGNDRYRKNDSEKQNENTRKEKNDISPDADDSNSADKHRNDCPSWVTEKINSGPDPRTRNPEKLKDSHWEENRNENSGNSWNKNFGSGWMSNRGRGNRGRGAYRGGFAYTDQNENRWQNRKPLSGNSNSSGNETFKFVEQQPYKRKSEQEFSFDTPADRSGWTSASSWAVRKTLPADVQNYYSRRGRNSSGPQSGWMRQEEETTEQDSNLKDQTNQQGDGSQLPINMMQPQMNVMQQQMNAQHQPMNIFPYPVGVHAPLMNLQRSPFNMHPQLPLHLHTGVPLMQKLQIQEKAAQEVKLAIKPFYQNKDITKEEYKEIVRKAVDKVCHSKSGEVNSTKVANLVKAYVDKYKYSRKGSQKKTLEEPVSTDKNIG